MQTLTKIPPKPRAQSKAGTVGADARKDIQHETTAIAATSGGTEAPSSTRPGAVTNALTYQEVLRTLGELLDTCGCDTAVLRLDRRGAKVTAAHWRYPARWTAEALQRESARQHDQRLVSPEEPPFEGLRWCLRPVGALLDAAVPGKWVITIGRDALTVRGRGKYRCTFDLPSLRHLALDGVCTRAPLATLVPRRFQRPGRVAEPAPTPQPEPDAPGGRRRLPCRPRSA